MGFCPNCEAEYREELQVCPDCDLELVDKLTPENKVHDTSDWNSVPLRSFGTGAEAEMVKALLDRNEIRSFVQGGNFAIAPGGFSGEVVLMVDERDLSRAVELYDAFFGAGQSPAPTSENDSEDEQ